MIKFTSIGRKLLLLWPILVSGVVYSADFADSKQGILDELLKNPQSLQTKSFAKQTEPVAHKVLSESDGGSGTKNFEVVERSEAAPRVSLKVEFDVNSDRLRPNARKILNELAAALTDSRLADKKLVINGHTDTTGTEEYNYDLSFRRARTVRTYLASYSNARDTRLDIRGFGEVAPIADNQSAVGRQLNRRVEIEVLY